MDRNDTMPTPQRRTLLKAGVAARAFGTAIQGARRCEPLR